MTTVEASSGLEMHQRKTEVKTDIVDSDIGMNDFNYWLKSIKYSSNTPN